MATMIRAELSERNQYWISKHRHYELKHFCLQYPDWKREYALLGVPTLASSILENLPNGNNMPSDPTVQYILKKDLYFEKISLIERIAMETDKYLYEYILKAVTEGLSYTYLKSRLNMPCGKSMYYDRYRKFFWLLSKTRN